MKSSRNPRQVWKDLKYQTIMCKSGVCYTAGRQSIDRFAIAVRCTDLGRVYSAAINTASSKTIIQLNKAVPVRAKFSDLPSHHTFYRDKFQNCNFRLILDVHIIAIQHYAFVMSCFDRMILGNHVVVKCIIVQIKH